jgi:SAM-dependent methyltransferase
MNAQCPVCDGRGTIPLYKLADQPVVLNQFFATRASALRASRAELNYLSCCACGFVWNAAFDPEGIEYGPGYVNDQSQSPRFRQHLSEVQRRLARGIEAVTGCILEIGCGQGSFLGELCRRTGRNGVGFDPAFEGQLISEQVKIHAEPFDEHACDSINQADVALLICRHVLEHMHQPRQLIELMARMLRANPKALAYFEIPAFEWIAEHRCFFDFFNEHCSLFTERSMRTLLNSAGLCGFTIERVFDDQYFAVSISANLEQPAQRKAMHWHDVPVNSAGLVQMRELWRKRITGLLRECQVVLWGAGAKCVSFTNQLGLTHELVPWVVDINPAKRGRYLPITGQKVIGPEELRTQIGNDDPLCVLVMNPTYCHEISETVQQLGLIAELECVDGSIEVAIHD